MGPPGFEGVGGGGSAEGDNEEGGQATRSRGGTAWRGYSGAWRHPTSEPGEWAHFRERHEGTHGRSGGQGISASTSSFIFINTCKLQEPFNVQGRGAEPTALLAA